MSERNSAYSVAAVRAASWLARSHVRHEDYVARHLLPWHLRLAVDVPPLRWAAVTFFDRFIRGLYGTHIARTRVFDLAVQTALQDGLRQVVVLGAGLDSRALRLAGKYGARTWELDLPDNQATKRDRLRRAGMDAPGTTYLPADLAEDWGPKLREAGFDPTRRTVWLLEGVSMYLEQPVFEHVLRTIAEMSVSGSHFHFDFYSQDVFDHPERFPSARRHFDYMANRGECYTLGLDPDALPALAAEHGFACVEQLSPPTLEARFLTDEGGAFAARTFGFLHIAHLRRESELKNAPEPPAGARLV